MKKKHLEQGYAREETTLRAIVMERTSVCLPRRRHRVTLEFSCIHSSREQANLARAKAGILLRSEPNNGG